MTDIVARIKRACNQLSWNNEFFMEPVCAYLTRKLRHVMDKVPRGKPLSSSNSNALLLVSGSDYYASLQATNADGDRIYFPAKLMVFKLSGNWVLMELETVDKSGQPHHMVVRYVKGPMLKILFVPKEEYEKDPLGVIVLQERSLAAMGDCGLYGPPPTDWSTYDSDMKKILSSIALRCPQFTMPPSMLPDTGKEKPFSISKGGNPPLHFVEVDHGLSFKPFFGDKTSTCDEQERADLLRTSAMCETNRCFFIHLGVALGLHPVAVQAIFRDYSGQLLAHMRQELSKKTSEDDQRLDAVTLMDESLQSVLNHNDLIDAPVLSALWPQVALLCLRFLVACLTSALLQELKNVRILIFSVGHAGPQPSLCYLFNPLVPADSADSFNGTDVVLKLQGMHFTLLRPRIEDASSSPIDQILTIFPEIDPIQPLHFQEGPSGALVREVGPVRSLADLHSVHACAAVPASAHLNANVGEPEPYD